MTERWLPIIGYEDQYLVSDHGRVMLISGKILKSQFPHNGYPVIALGSRGNRKTHLIHRLVAKHFCDGYSHGLQVNHKDGVRSNAHYSNLEWVTDKQNREHKYRVLKSINPMTGKSLGLHHRAVPVIGTREDGTGYIFSCAMAANAYGFDNSAIAKACKGQRPPKHKGYNWSFANV